MFEKVNDVLKSAIDKGELAGANVLVFKDGEEKVYAECGYRDKENKIPMSRDTILRMYSQTKPITSAAVALLMAQGKFDLSDALCEYLPEFGKLFVNENGVRREAKKLITLRDLMNMTSGYSYPNEDTVGGRQCGKVFDIVAERLYSENPVTTAEFARLISQTDLCFEPGESFMYGISADILGAVIEKISGMSFRDFLMKNFFEPLEMSDTDFYVPAEKSSRLSKVYKYSDNGLIENVTDNLGVRYKRDVIPAFQSGGAGICSTLDDYAKFALMLLNGGTYNGRRILPEYAVRFMTHGGNTESQNKQLWNSWTWTTGYTYGNLMRICDDESKTSLFSSYGEYGWDGWLGTFFSNEPEHGITLLFGTQQTDVGKGHTTARKLKNVIMSELI